ncbi:MAG TPA: ATP-grasp domain-containing protein [Actinobacteria bacterium]|nr:ATP-grasp domain-containing protein [Actinomycetes bacterium]HEX21045.1 ATP-grasp domain-containing protein [Actinomycetota bacterium]
MDKIRSKLFFASLGIPTPFYLPVHKSELKGNSISKISARILDSLSVPMVVKPTKAGSAIGVEIIKRKDKVKPALAQGLMESDELIVEEYIEGPEVTVGIIGNDDLQTLPIVEIVSENEFYDFEAKYDGKSRHIIPANIPKVVADKVNRYALAAHVGLGCRNFSRVDFIIGREDHIPYILEINTIPGMTDVSLFPDAARVDGMEFPDLIEHLVQLALEE